MKTKREHLTREQALELLERAVKEKGADYVYPEEERAGGKACQYAVEDEDGNLRPSCIVGHVFNYLGLLREAHHYEGSGADGVLYALGLGDRMEDSGKLSAATILVRAQARQDAAWTWGESLERAKRVP